MSLPGSPVSLGSRWAPTHVQVTVLQARGLRAKAKGGGGGGGGGGSDAYAVMALGKEKFATSVAERCQGSPVWREEATFELPPPPRRSLGAGPPPAAAALQLTVFHRALLGLDKFLGRAEISLAELQSEGGRRSTRWYKLHSKPGKKEKERGEIEVDIQFMRSNMTASMFDLSMKDKSRTPLGKLKDKLKGKRGHGLPDTASAIIPSISHSPADSEEESNEKEKKKSKFKTLFSKPGLQKNNLSQSMSVLPTHQEVPGRVRLKPSDFQSKWSDGEDDEDDTLTPVSEKPLPNRADSNMLYPPSAKSHKRTGSGDSRQLNQITGSNAKKESHSLFGLKSKSDPASRSNVCINGSHIYMEEHESKSDTSSKDSTPSSPQTSQRRRLFLSQENLSSDLNKEPENTGQFPPDKGTPGMSSLDSFKAMTLPSYKLLSGGDLLETQNPVISDTPKETKENKKQENKKSGLLSLVTGRKEGKTNEEGENSVDASLKVKEAKREEKDLAKKEGNPFEVPVDNTRRPGPEKSGTAEVPRAKASLNPFDEGVREEEKAGKTSASVKPSQTKPVKPRMGVSSEDETKAASTAHLPPSASLFYPSYRSANENNPFTSKQKAQDADTFSSSLITLSAKSGNNPFVTRRERGTEVEGVDCSPTESFPSHSPAPGKEINPFSPLWGQASQTQGPENSAESAFYSQPPFANIALETHSPPCQPSSADDLHASDLEKGSEDLNRPPTSTLVAGNSDDSKYIRGMKPEKESTSNPEDAVLGSAGALSASELGVTLKSPGEDKVHVVPPFKENSGRMKKSVTFAHEELKDDGIIDRDSEASEGGSSEKMSEVRRAEDGNGDAVKPIENCRWQGQDPDGEHPSASKPLDGGPHGNDNPPEKETIAASWIAMEAPSPAPRALVTLPKETNSSKVAVGSGPSSVPPKPAPRAKQKDTGSPLASDLKAEEAPRAEFEKLSPSNSVSKEVLIRATSSATPESTGALFGRECGTIDPPQGTSSHSSIVLSVQPPILTTGDLNGKGTVLPVILEVGSDDEQLSDGHQDAEKMAVRGDSSRNGGSSRESALLPTEEVAGEEQAAAPSMKTSSSSKTSQPKELLLSPSAVRFPNEGGLEGNDAGSRKEDGEGRPEFSGKPVSVSSSSLSHSVNSFPSDVLGSNSAESPKKSTTEGLDAKVETSGQKKLLQARVSPSETHPNLPLQSGATYPAKLRLQPVKPMNATASKQPAKPLNTTTKILDNQNEASPKKYDPSDPAYAYAQLTHDELIQLVLKQKEVIAKRDLQVRELEDYIDNLLVRVMEETPNILRVQAHVSKKAGKM